MALADPRGLIFAKQISEWGWKIAPGFISKAGAKVPLCGDWTKNATKNVTQLEKWWASRPWLWPGVVSGVGSCLVVDCDKPDAVELFLSWGFEKEDCLSYHTPGKGGGLHAIWNWPSYLDKNFGQKRFGLETGGSIQFRGNNHFTMLIGCQRSDGKYSLINTPDKPSEFPRELWDRLPTEGWTFTGEGNSGNSEVKSISPEDVWKAAPYFDGRKNTLAGLAWFLVSADCYSDSEVLNWCLSFGRECCIPELDAEVCEKKAQYAINRWAAAKESSRRMEQKWGTHAQRGSLLEINRERIF